MRRTDRLCRGLLAAALCAAGCAADDLVMQTGIPGARSTATVLLTRVRGVYLDVLMDSGSFRYRFFLPDNADCRAVVNDESGVTYAQVGVLGQLSSGDAVCDPIGILSLAQWRDRGPRSRRPGVIPRSQAQFRGVYRDEELGLVRGRFLLAGEIRWPGGGDTIAVLPNVAECQGLLEGGTASMEFRPLGRQPFHLIDGNQRCPIIGFVQVPRMVPGMVPRGGSEDGP